MLDAGDVCAGYVIERVLGRGGMGSVYLARHPRLRRLVALKLLNSDLFANYEMRTRFEREADLVARLDHPGIVAVYDRGVEGDQPWIAMQYVDGFDAGTIDPAVLPPDHAVQIIGRTAEALDYAHSVGVLHRDVKPGNILISRADGDGWRTFLADFGIARLRGETGHLTQIGAINATLSYASPEQLTGAGLDHRSDQYSLACTLFWLLSGRAPFQSENSAAVIKGQLQEAPPELSAVRPGLPPALDIVFARGLAKRPVDRFASCTEFATAAWHALTSGVAPAGYVPVVSVPTPEPVRVEHGPPPISPAPKQRFTRASVLVGAGIALVVVLGVGVGIVVGTQTSTSPAAAPKTTSAAPTADPQKAKDEAEATASIKSISAAFPKLVPADISAPNGSKLTGYEGRECNFIAKYWRPYVAPDEVNYGNWVGGWRCNGKGDAGFTILSYRSPADVQSAVGALAAERSVDAKNGHSYTNYKLFNKDRNGNEAAVMITTFPDDPERASYLMYLTPAWTGRAQMDKLVNWWNQCDAL
ncbi:serine/threonine-protein kinase [Nocardia wallacei]|uniref:serine/threonine-protein kinase n=1 Tax=Nocardia wallacei TaxID=480035 RepID=UPI0024552D5B|nr:serine/threonine-protein kinase [Nocardia wallacei]